ncbi:hypothetical protein GGS20DRAFT_317632 [Poronia punctata]|nr:hypothetical protein GGS20DRAFT_317632 [Poronia punctata]
MSGNQTPNLNSPKVKSSSSNSSPFPGTTATTTTPFTPEMRSRQARGKDPYHSNSEDEMTWMPGYGSVEKAPTSGDAPPRQQAHPNQIPKTPMWTDHIDIDIDNETAHQTRFKFRFGVGVEFASCIGKKVNK